MQTDAGFIQGLNERIDTWWQDTHQKDVPRGVHLGISIASLLAVNSLSCLGIIRLIVSGYTAAGWALFVAYIIPLITIGVHKLFRKTSQEMGERVLLDAISIKRRHAVEAFRRFEARNAT